MSNVFTKGSEWRRWDLQVQTILDDGYKPLKSYYQELKAEKPQNWQEFVDSVGSEEAALKYDSKEYFHSDSGDDEKARAKNYAKTFVRLVIPPKNHRAQK